MSVKITRADAQSFYFIRWEQPEDQIVKPVERVQDITRGSINGVALKKLGIRGQARQIIGIRDLQASNWKDFLQAWQEMAGTIVTITDNQGVDHTNVAIVQVPAPRLLDIVNPVGGFYDSDGVYLAYQPFMVLDTQSSTWAYP